MPGFKPFFYFQRYVAEAEYLAVKNDLIPG